METRLFQLSIKDCDVCISFCPQIFQGSEFDGSLVAVTQGRAYCFIPSFFMSPSPSRDADTLTNKFVMVATVLHKSWPFADTAWPYIDEIRSAEEEKANASGSAGGGGGKGKKPPSASSKSGSGAKPKKGKGGGKDGGGKDGSDGVNSCQSLSNIDGSKPHWTLRVAIRQRDKDQFEMGRDTEREDELKSMQTTWETQQPGRLKQVRCTHKHTYTNLTLSSHKGSRVQTEVPRCPFPETSRH